MKVEPTPYNERRTRFFYWLGAALISAISFGGASSLVVMDYDQRLGFTGRDLLILAKTLAQHTTQVLENLDALAIAIADDRRRVTSSEELSAMLERRVTAEPGVIDISVTDRSGVIVASSDPTRWIGRNISAIEDYHALSAPDTSLSYISKPLRPRGSSQASTNIWAFRYSRAIRSDEGEFAGITIITINIDLFHDMYSSVSPGIDGVVYLVGTDGIIRAWSGHPQTQVGSDVRPVIASDLILSEGTRIRPGLFRGMQRIFAFSGVSGFPLAVYVSIAAWPVYKAIITTTVIVIVLLVVLVSALIALGLLLHRYMQERERLTRTLVAAAAERQERVFLESILHTGSALVLVTDGIGRLVVANPAFLELFAPEPDKGQLQSWLAKLFGRTLDEISTSLPYSGDVNIPDRRGRRREISWNITAIWDEGQVKNFVCIGFDNTDRREAELAIFQAGKLITLGEMATGLAHEINQPLGTIGMAIENLSARLDGRKADEGYIRQVLGRIAAQVQRAAAIVDHMRIFGRRSERRLAPLDPVEAIEGALIIADAQLRAAGISLRRGYSRGDYAVLADQILLEQVVLNIILNARDAILDARCPGREGPPDWIEIALTAGQDDSTVHLSISDSGTGIAPAIIERIFDPFFTTKAVGKGTGLGLALSYGMVKEFGGVLRARNTDAGAQFTITLLSASSSQWDTQGDLSHSEP